MPYLVSPTYSVKLARWFHVDAAYTVVKYPNGTYLNVVDYKVDAPIYESCTAVYLGGRVNYVDSTEAAALTAAGYTVT